MIRNRNENKLCGSEKRQICTKSKRIDESDARLLLEAVDRGNKEEVALLLFRRGVDVNRRNRRDMTALHIAAQRCNGEMVKFLIVNGANVNSANDYGATALHEAVLCSQKDIVEFLISSGADVNAMNRFSWLPTPLTVAVICKHDEIAEMLRKHGGRLVIPRRPRGRYDGHIGIPVDWRRDVAHFVWLYWGKNRER